MSKHLRNIYLVSVTKILTVARKHDTQPSLLKFAVSLANSLKKLSLHKREHIWVWCVNQGKHWLLDFRTQKLVKQGQGQRLQEKKTRAIIEYTGF